MESAENPPSQRWQEAFARQVARGDLSDIICRLLELSSGDDLIDLGCGPGYPSICLAKRLFPGTVYAIDNQPGAIAYLAAHRDNTTRISPIVADIRSLPYCLSEPRASLLAFVLHHIERPLEAIESVGAELPRSSTLLILEYCPDGAGEVGPPCNQRIPRENIRHWLETAGFSVHKHCSLPQEKYAICGYRC